MEKKILYEEQYELLTHWVPFEYKDTSGIKSFSKGNFKVEFSKSGLKLNDYVIKDTHITEQKELKDTPKKDYLKSIYDTKNKGDLNKMRLREQLEDAL